MKKTLSAVWLALLSWLVLLSPVSVLAGGTGDTVISGQVPATITLTVPDDFDIGTLVPEQVTSSAKTVTVASNITGWSLVVAENGTSPDGKMARTSPADAQTLTAIMEVRGGDFNTYTPLSSAVTLISGSSSATATVSNIYFKQCVATADSPGTYSITVVFTAATGL
jgi:hypothetical protein